MIDENKPVKVKIDVDYEELAERGDALLYRLVSLNKTIDTLKKERDLLIKQLCDLYADVEVS